MARYPNLPGMTTEMIDGNLSVAAPADLNDSILLIGTAENGPVNTPLSITSLNDVEVFGNKLKGSLSRGIYEAWYAQGGNRNIRALRISNGQKAKLVLAEADSSGLAAEQATEALFGFSLVTKPALILESNIPSSVYNGFSIRMDRDDQGKLVVVLSNPITGLESQYTYSSDVNATADVHDVQELVAAINNDENMYPYITATTTTLTADFDAIVDPSGTSTVFTIASGVVNEDLGVSVTANNTLRFSLSDRLESFDAVGDTYAIYNHYDGTSATVLTTAGNRIDELTKVGELAFAYGQVISAAGYSTIDLPYAPIAYGCGGTAKSAKLPYYKQVFENAYIGTAETSTESYYDYEFDSYLAPDLGSGTALTYAELVAYKASGTLPAYNIDGAGSHNITISAYDSIDTDNGTTITRAAPTSVEYVQYTPSTFTVYEVIGGVRTDATDLGHKFAVSWDTTTKKAKVTFIKQPDLANNGYPAENTEVLVTYQTIEGQFTELTTLAAVTNDTSGLFSKYFVSGNRVYFAATLPTAIRLSYNYEKTYEVGNGVTIYNEKDGVLEFGDAYDQPGTSFLRTPPPVVGSSTGIPSPDWSLVTTINRVSIRALPARMLFYYEYLPEWMSLNTTALSLSGGTDGINMTNEQKYQELESVFGLLENYAVDHIVLLDARFDDTKEVYNPATGIKQTVNAGFALLFSEFLENLPETTQETFGYMPVVFPTGRNLETVKSWVNDLTIYDVSDPTRAANIKPLLNCKFLQVVAVAGVMNNLSMQREYVSNCLGAYVGLVASLPDGEETTFKNIPGLVYPYAAVSRGQANAIAGMGFVGIMPTTTKGYVVASDDTCALPGSDYYHRSVVNTVKRCLKDVREVCMDFLGKPNNTAMKNAMTTGINDRFLERKKRGSLLSSAHEIIATANDRVLQRVQVNLILRPALALRHIITKVVLSK